MGNTPSAPVAIAATEAPAAAQFAAAAAAPAAATTSECPVSEETRQAWAGRWGGSKKAATDAAGLDPKNNMPAVPLQGAAPGQASSLDTTRVKSTIPKGDDGASLGATWEYPSPQMFWNAMVRKNKTGGASEDDMGVVVAIHNNMNETTWADVCAWEALSAGGGATADGVKAAPPKLLRFTGRPFDTSPKARLKQALLGCPLPFDRHDWVVLRGDGEEVRYVIDYYHDDRGVDADGPPQLHDTDSVRSIVIDVRPALDTPHALFCRALKMPLATFLAPGLPTNTFKHLPLAQPRDRPGAAKYGPTSGGNSSSGTDGGNASEGWGATLAALVASWGMPRAETHDGQRPTANYAMAKHTAKARVAQADAEKAAGLHKQGRLWSEPSLPPELKAVGERLAGACGGCRARADACEGEADCSRAYMALTYCTAQIVCAPEAAAFGQGLESGASEAELEHLYSRVVEGVGAFENRAQQAAQGKPKILK